MTNTEEAKTENLLRTLVARWQQDSDEEALRTAVQIVFLSTLDLSGEVTSAAFDDLRSELGALYLTAATGAKDEREAATRLLTSLLKPDRGRGAPRDNAVIQRDAIVRAYLHRAARRQPAPSPTDRDAELENEVLPRAKKLCGWPDDFKIDADTALRSVRARAKPKSKPTSD